MNKVYTIGRDPSCDIVIVDTTDVVSRVHASLKVKGHGKYVLVDQGRNGTYVNGIKMSPNEEIPVTRKDVISFAHVTDLDWNQIPKEKSRGLIWTIVALIVVAVAVAVLYTVLNPEPAPVAEPEEIPTEVLPDINVKNDTVRDTVFIKEAPKPVQEKKKEPKKMEPVEETPVKEEVIDAIY